MMVLKENVDAMFDSLRTVLILEVDKGVLTSAQAAEIFNYTCKTFKMKVATM